MISRRVGVLTTLVVLIGICSAGAAGAASSGPRLALALYGERQGSQIVSIDAAGSDLRKIAGGREGDLRLDPLGEPSWSGDGTFLAFGARPRTRGPESAIYLVMADGSRTRKVRGTAGGFSPVLSPDGRTLAFARERKRIRRHPRGGQTVLFESVSTWTISLQGGAARRLTPWRDEVEYSPSSFSPDGKTLALTRNTPEGPAAVALPLDGGQPVLLAEDAGDPAYSPDGSRLALALTRTVRAKTYGPRPTEVFVSDLAVGNADGSGLRLLTRTPRFVELAPSWDPSGQRLAFGRYVAYGKRNRLDDTIEEINADGTCRRLVFGLYRVWAYGPAWQPGPGRAAGRIPC